MEFEYVLVPPLLTFLVMLVFCRRGGHNFHLRLGSWYYYGFY